MRGKTQYDVTYYLQRLCRDAKKVKEIVHAIHGSNLAKTGMDTVTQALSSARKHVKAAVRSHAKKKGQEKEPEGPKTVKDRLAQNARPKTNREDHPETTQPSSRSPHNDSSSPLEASSHDDRHTREKRESHYARRGQKRRRIKN